MPQMSPELVGSALLAPLLFWAAYHYYHDRHRPEPVVKLIAALALGVAASWLATWGYRSLDLFGLRHDAVALARTNLPGLMAYAILAIGLIEELAKMLPFVIVVLRFRDFDEPMDGIVYASFLALGFATVENFHYLDLVSRGEALARGFAGPVVHIVFASVWGYHLGLAKVRGEPVVRAALAWLAITAVLHGLYDFVVLAFPGPALLASAAIVAGVWLWRLRTIRRLHGDAEAAAEDG